VQNVGKRLLEITYIAAENAIEKKIDLWILVAKLENELVPEEISKNSLIRITEPELALITAKTILRYLS